MRVCGLPAVGWRDYSIGILSAMETGELQRVSEDETDHRRVSYGEDG